MTNRTEQKHTGVPVEYMKAGKEYHIHCQTEHLCVTETKANAEFIVKAVNNFYLLVKALTDILASNNLKEAKEYADKTMRNVQET